MSLKQFSPGTKGYNELAHSFAYADKKEAGTTSCGRMSYQNNCVYAYSRMIARKIDGSETKSGCNVLLLNNERYSNTVTKQRNQLKSALNHYQIIYVDYLTQNFIDDSIDKYEENLRRLITSDYLKLKPNRLKFAFIYEQLELINEHIQTTTEHRIYADIVDNIRNNDINTPKTSR